MKAVKGNKEYTINVAQKKSYQENGFDIVDDDGKLITYGKGKTVPYSDYAALRKENEELCKKIKELESELQASGIESAEPEAQVEKTQKKVGEKKAGD